MEIMRVFVVLFLLASQGGCTNYNLDPPRDGEKFLVRVKAPSDIKADRLAVIYISTQCQEKYYNFASPGAKYSNRFKVLGVDLKSVGNELYEVSLEQDGGGACQWSLYKATLKVVYRHPERFSADIASSYGDEVSLEFYRDAVSNGSTYSADKNVLVVPKSYYPWISEGFIGGYSKSFILFGRKSSYGLRDKRQVYFDMVMHSEFAVYSVGPKYKDKGSYEVFTYPSGRVENSTRSEPDFDKLEADRLDAERKKGLSNY
ncbi:hypothetical protein ACQCLI_13755 [Pseudomonas nitroreducens]|uniref:hypothetical protein n=1 Tax=Pseudomonas nitroreducens TaxID=46680 RepID=UPI0012FD641D|nr:hypothetical protein [Pseudomonas nitroreducens]